MKQEKHKSGQQGITKKQGALKVPSSQQLLNGLREGNAAMLARAITLVESTRPRDREAAYAILENCPRPAGHTLRIGITGVPGAGKSTFIEALGRILVGQRKKVAVLAIDPTSSLSHGSILGDKTRMPELAQSPFAFIRPTAAGGNLGGVARSTRESIMLCEAAGYEVILVETVGVGQSETAVHSMVDFFLLILLAGAGDELQGIKRGIIEMADALVIGKADGGNVERAGEARAACERALHMYPPKENGWVPEVRTCSAIQNRGVSEIWALILSYAQKFEGNGYLQARRREQNKYWLAQAVESRLTELFYSSESIRQKRDDLTAQVEKGVLSPFRAATLLLEAYKGDLK